MGFDKLWQLLLAIPALLLTGFSLMAPMVQAPSPTTVRRESPRPTISPTNAPTAAKKPTGLAPTPISVSAPKPSAAPVPAATPPVAVAAKTEIATEQVCPGQSDVAQTPVVITCLTAHARTFHGLPSIAANGALMAAAASKNQDMLSCGYGHTACGREFGYWMTAKGYTGRCTAENIALGQTTPHEVFVDWMNSAGHRANILNASYKDIGAAELASPGGPLWTMELGGC